MTFRLGVDVGGTFTDLVLASPSGEVTTRKVLSATGDYAVTIIDDAAVTLDLAATDRLRAELRAEHAAAAATGDDGER
jgi:N-methylhydantoinase A